MFRVLLGRRLYTRQRSIIKSYFLLFRKPCRYNFGGAFYIKLRGKDMNFPKVGQRIYLPTALYLSHGKDDFDGGKCVVSKIKIEDSLPAGHPNRVFFAVEENPGHLYSWEHYGNINTQRKYKKQYGNRKGKRDPDYRPEFNRWP